MICSLWFMGLSWMQLTAHVAPFSGFVRPAQLANYHFWIFVSSANISNLTRRSLTEGRSYKQITSQPQNKSKTSQQWPLGSSVWLQEDASSYNYLSSQQSINYGEHIFPTQLSYYSVTFISRTSVFS